MASNYWLKLWLDILDDPKVGRMSDWLFRRFILLLLAAKEYDHNGQLQPVPDLAYRLRLTEELVGEALRALAEVGVTREDAQGWWIVNFVKRQESKDPTNAERQRRFREKKRNDNNALRDALPSSLLSSSSASDSVSDSSLNSLTPQKNIFQLYEQNIGPIAPLLADELRDAEREYQADWLEEAFKIAVEANVRKWKYVLSILQRWKAQGYKSNGKSDTKDSTTLKFTPADEMLKKYKSFTG